MIQVNLIHTTETAIFSILHHEEILKRFLAASCNEAVFKQGENLCQKYNVLDQQHREGQQRAREADRKLREVRKHLKLRYMRHLSIAKLTFKDIPEHWEKLGINSEHYPDLQSWIKQAQRFYYHAKPSGEQKKSYGISHSELEEISLTLGQLAELSSLRKQAMSYTQRIIQQKQECYTELEQWMQKFTGFAKVALVNEPQYLENLGILPKAKAV